MYFFLICLVLPTINAIVVVEIHQSAIYHPVSSCAFIRNASWSTDASIQSCIWECVYEHNCQTAVYFTNEKICSMFIEFCNSDSIQSSGDVRASVICYRKDQEPTITCSSTMTPNQAEEEKTTIPDTMTSTAQSATNSNALQSTTTTTNAETTIETTALVTTKTIPTSTRATTSTTTSTKTTTTGTRSAIISLTKPGDNIVGLYNTTAGQSTGGFNGTYSGPSETPPYAIDGDVYTKYLNYGSNLCFGCVVYQPGIGTGFFVISSVSNTTVACALHFATGGDTPTRDPITVTLEGSNGTTNAILHQGSSWTLIYNGSTGIKPTVDPGRSTYVAQQNFSNTMVFASYRLLITSQRGNESSVQYSEAQIMGYT